MDGNHVANLNGLEMVEREELHSDLESLVTPLIPFNHSNDHQMENDVIRDIKAMLQLESEGPSLSTRTYCIYKVPHDIRRQNEDAYTPKVVSIGPLHHGNPTLQNMETHKRILFKKFIQRTKTSLDDLVSFVECLEPRVRACYSENIVFTKEEFVKLVLIDASSIISLFLLEHDKDWLEEDSYLRQPRLMANITLDLLLLENQLPFFIVEGLFNRAFPFHICGDLPPFIMLTSCFFSDFNSQMWWPSLDICIKHFTDLLRMFHLPRKEVLRRSTDEARIHNLLYNSSAHGLFEAGVKFKVSASKCLLDLKFSKGILEIPQISVTNVTETLFRNMIALEQFYYPYETYISDYVFVLDRLINTSIDVDVLIGAKIINNNLGESDLVARLFNGVGQSISLLNVGLDYFDIFQQLNKFCKDPYEHFQSPYNYMMFTLTRDYCNTPWRTMASIAGVVLLILTLVQTIFTIIK